MPRGLSGIASGAKRFAEPDLYGRPKFGGVDLISFELAAAASLLFGQTDEGIPVVIARGCDYELAEDAVGQDREFLSAKKILKEVLKVSIGFRASELFFKFGRPFRRT